MHRDEGDGRDSKNGMVEVAARQHFDMVGLGIPLASELALMIPKATGFALQSPCMRDRTTWGPALGGPQNQGLGGEHPFYPLHPCKKTSMHPHPFFGWARPDATS